MRFRPTFILACWLAASTASAQTTRPQQKSTAEAQRTQSSDTQVKQKAERTNSSEPEEPDFAFVASGPYTQLRNSIQLIHQFSYGTRRFAELGGSRKDDEFLFSLRTEYGFTDRWELDVITPAVGTRERLNGQALTSDFGYGDSVLGVRYRLLNEGRAPFTLTMGPKFILPTGDVSRGTGSGSAGFAWDVTAAKDWNGPVFLYSSMNYRALPSADDPTPGSTRQFALHSLSWATALGLRVLERQAGDAKHDAHAFLEGGGSWGHEIESGTTVGFRQAKLSWVFSPGIRYGFLTARKTLIEIGVATPFGLGPNGPKRALVLQFQFEWLFGNREE